MAEQTPDASRLADLEAALREAAAGFDVAAHAIETEMRVGRRITMGDTLESDAEWLRSEADRLRALVTPAPAPTEDK